MNEPAQNYHTEILVDTQYISAQSEPDNGKFVFSYTITIKNNGTVPTKLLRRHWIITDANGNVQEVEGKGVVGEQPYLKPGEGFRYTSGTILSTPVGSMHGQYMMIADDGIEFSADIAPFTLARPNFLH
ncbi:MAG: Co2+/Mg2+ efflux protein ApaG [Gammaproteobacteria bacterium]|nr:Co2+/Mg2+ efflux protein ApaG [Gammaproteobacteria bacterium]